MLAFLVEANRPLDVTRELAPMLALPNTKSMRVSLLRAARSLEQRGLVRLSRSTHPDRRGVLAEATNGASGELLARDLQRAARSG